MLLLYICIKGLKGKRTLIKLMEYKIYIIIYTVYIHIIAIIIIFLKR